MFDQIIRRQLQLTVVQLSDWSMTITSTNLTPPHRAAKAVAHKCMRQQDKSVGIIVQFQN